MNPDVVLKNQKGRPVIPVALSVVTLLRERQEV